jgi:hypothetical protein
MNSFKKIRHLKTSPFNYNNEIVFYMSCKHKEAYRMTDRASIDHPLFFRNDYYKAKNKLIKRKMKYIWFLNTKHDMCNREIQKEYKHKDPEMKGWAMWFIFWNKKEKHYETRVVKCV